MINLFFVFQMQLSNLSVVISDETIYYTIIPDQLKILLDEPPYSKSLYETYPINFGLYNINSKSNRLMMNSLTETYGYSRLCKCLELFIKSILEYYTINKVYIRYVPKTNSKDFDIMNVLYAMLYMNYPQIHFIQDSYILPILGISYSEKHREVSINTARRFLEINYPNALSMFDSMKIDDFRRVMFSEELHIPISKLTDNAIQKLTQRKDRMNLNIQSNLSKSILLSVISLFDISIPSLKIPYELSKRLKSKDPQISTNAHNDYVELANSQFKTSLRKYNHCMGKMSKLLTGNYTEQFDFDMFEELDFDCDNEIYEEDVNLD